MAANAEAMKEGIRVPLTLEDYCIKQTPKKNVEPMLDASFYDDFDMEAEDDIPTDEYDDDEDDDDFGDDDDAEIDSVGDDSGKGETF